MLMFTIMTIPMIIYLMWCINTWTISYKEKSSTFECGFEPLCLNRIPFSLRFFKLLLIFLIFDIEIILMLPIPLTNETNYQSFLLINTFMLILFLGLLFEWQQGCLNWLK